MRNKTVFTRWFFIISSIFIISLILWNTYQFFTQLKENERNKMEIWAAAQEEFQQVSTNENWNSKLILKILQSNTTTPMILFTHREGTYTSNNIDPEFVKDIEKREDLIQQYVSEYKPIDIVYNGEVLQTIYYGNSPIINKIKYYPATLIVIILLFFLAVFFFYQTSKSAEQNKLWAGMAKETAHQIGTPLSSLVGWAEILKTENVNPEYISEIEKDISRLKTITERFSKIGSVPTLQKVDLVAETKSSYDYLKSRTSKMIEFHLTIPNESIEVQLNPQLYSWTIENLVKNGIDAMRGQGSISVEIMATHKKALVHISDTGKGLAKKDFKKIFVPGFTTKKRGWGLGLSLSKRIIEDYHNGKIQVLKSVKNEGTTIEIALPLT
ncbi:MAG: two-component sensor histidine kinase [Flavobacteriaceae bacterium]|nr:two-component sensor histidine kinase [Flavobacteriaceae bacterium]|tara:strand:- start:101299 stop:102447 length:1149 start_codon:yes stop_codon:yes gene_type:complete